MPYFIYPVVVALILAALILLFLKSCREEVFGLSFFLACIFLVLAVTSYREYIIADKYSYVASIGIFYFIAIVGYKLFKKYAVSRWIKILVVFFCLVSCSFLTWKQNKLWSSPLKLFQNSLEQYPRSPVIMTTLGSIAVDSGMYHKAIEYLDQAISIDPDNVYSYFNRGVAEARLENTPKALNDLSKAIYLNPNYLDPYFARANIYSGNGDYQQAMDDYTYILSRDVNHSGAWQNRAIVKGNLGDFQGAVDDLNHAVSLNPNSGSAYYLRGVAKFEMHLNGCDDLEKALSLKYQAAQKALQHYCK